MIRYTPTPAQRWANRVITTAYGIRERLPAILREPKASTFSPEQPDSHLASQSPVGKVLPIIRGSVPLEGHCIWAHGPYGSTDDPALWDAAYAFCHNAYDIPHYVIKVWIADKLMYDATGETWAFDPPIVRLHQGELTQSPDPRIVQIEGASMAPGWPTVVYAVVEAVNLRPYGNRPPPVSALVSTSYNQPAVNDYEATVY